MPEAIDRQRWRADSVQPAFGCFGIVLRAMGMRVAIDDAAAGYASMRHILNIRSVGSARKRTLPTSG